MNKCNTGLSWEQDIHKEQMFGKVFLAYARKLTGVVAENVDTLLIISIFLVK